MGIIYNTSMTPSKNELVARWLVAQDFYGGNGAPKLKHIGGFRLEDPAGRVGIELRFYADDADFTDVVYNVPLTYRDAPLESGDEFLLGTSEHGILGTRYIYDAEGDPVFTAQLAALAAGQTTPQHHSESFTDDPLVTPTGQLGGTTLHVVRRPTRLTPGTAAPQPGILGWWENALGQKLTGLVLGAN